MSNSTVTPPYSNPTQAPDTGGGTDAATVLAYTTPPPSMLPGPRGDFYGMVRTLTPITSSSSLKPVFAFVQFPCMPDVIQLSRKTDFKVTKLPGYPDGIHLYMGNEPLSIPISFKVHAFDTYCNNGPNDLIAMAAALHAMTLPVIAGVATTTTKTVNDSGATVPAYNEVNLQYNASANTTLSRITFLRKQGLSAATPTSSQAITGAPPLCALQLTLTPTDAGINLYGYVSSVDVKLKGPWLNTSSSSAQTGKNLPSSGDFSFTFVHAPGYWPDPTAANVTQTNAQVFSDFVLDKLYNTVSVSEASAGVGGS